MGGGFMFTGKPISSATRPPFIDAARNFHTGVSPPAADGGGTPQISHDNGDGSFGSAPTRAEVDRAILDLHRLMQGLQTSGPEPNGLHSLSPTNSYGPHMLQSPGFAKFHDVYSMMQKEPSFQSMVVSVSCDKGVWEAILGNKAVQDLKGSIPVAAENEEEDDDDMDIAPVFFAYIEAGARLLDRDASIMAISSWNDNEQGQFVYDPYVLPCSDFFPGLGWMPSRFIWDELSLTWAKAYWDDWVRVNEKYMLSTLLGCLRSLPPCKGNNICCSDDQ
ncbi:Alpha-1-3-mannosyl-glycoprotein 2-beta-N-acetylglucosaminyltransferase [Striga hermonthica]|uniref:Alpha-1,3-mannosyl-glycoprotein 2-beta-N-acetylglucosaminyltransferase n=1 Tax=Striga hermonthica TaxID=68872 RepID=A0A9N7MTC6_STRHE|nr:Alpha-1-3-mannosyl-glycoprotein 2-beta-N-acetylglucosaminyltransferase [Striga hermonthica]